MSSRKICIYKGCDKAPGRTMFKFPVENDRFMVWCANSGLELKGDVDITEPRYLCEKHFSINYISTQSRRKMLVHTAVPEKWKEDVDALETIKEVKIVGSPAKKRKIREYSMSELLSKPNVKLERPSPTLLNKLLKRKPVTIAVEEEESVVEEENEEQFETIEKMEEEDHPNVIYEEVSVPEQPKPKYKYVIIKRPSNESVQKLKSSPVKQEAAVKDVLYVSEEVEDTKISSTNIDVIESKKPESVKEVEKPQAIVREVEQLEGYTEFIWGATGEIYVQMPKRVFEAEKEKLRQEAEKYKAMLIKLKAQLNSIDLD